MIEPRDTMLESAIAEADALASHDYDIAEKILATYEGCFPYDDKNVLHEIRYAALAAGRLEG